MKEFLGLKSILWTQVMFYINASFFVFVGFDIWSKTDELSIYFLYFAMTIAYRALVIPLSAWFVLKDRTKELIVFSYACAFLLGLSALIGSNYVGNPYILVHMYSLPLALFTTTFQIGNNQLIVGAVQKEQYEHFFYITSLFRNGIDMLVPIMIGFAIYFVSETLSLVVMMLVALVSMMISAKLPKTTTGFRDKTFKDIWKQKESKERKHIARMHYLFIIMSSVVIQFLDISTQNYLALIGGNEWRIGVWKGIFVLLLMGVFVWKKKSTLTDKTWYYTAVFMAIAVLLVDVFTESLAWNTIIMVFLVVLIYVIHSSSISLSFKMVDSKTPFEQFAVLLKREVIRNTAKAAVAMAGFVLALQNTNTLDYKLFTAVVIVVLALSTVFYGKLNKTLSHKEKTS